MRNPLPALAFLLAATAAAFAQTDGELSRKMVGSWGDSAACAEGTLEFKADGTFVSMDTGGANRMDGTYQVVAGKLNGKADNEPMPEMSVTFEGENLVMANAGGTPETLVRCTRP